MGSVGSHQGPPVSLAQRLSKGSLRGFQGVPSNRGKHLLSHFNRMCEYGHVFPLYSFSSGAVPPSLRTTGNIQATATGGEVKEGQRAEQELAAGPTEAQSKADGG